MEVKYRPAAKNRLIEIWDYSERTWGEAQANSYVRGLIMRSIRRQAHAVSGGL